MRAIVFFISVLVTLAAPNARADEDTSATPKRKVPDYDGRGEPSDGTNAGVWLARILLSPLYFVSEYVLRTPLDGLMNVLERHDGLTKLYDFFAFGPDHKIGWAPVGFIEFGLLPSFGVYGFWNDALVHNNDLHLHIEAWPTDFVAASFADRYHWGRGHFVEVRASGVNRPDQLFYGIGRDSASYHQSRFREAKMDASATLDLDYWRSSHVRMGGGIRKVDISDGYFGRDPSLSAEARTGVFPIPFGFDRGYTEPYGTAGVSFDTRDPANLRTGFHVEADGEIGTDVQHGSTGWARWGGLASVYWDVDGHRRILSLTVGASFADPLGGDPIPFTELVTLGGDKWMTGYYPGRLRGRSGTIAMLRYDWPIASWIDGTLQAVVGNVWDEHLDGFDVGKLRFSGSVGIATSSEIIGSFAGAGQVATPARGAAAGPRIEVLAGFGTDTFDNAATVQSFHVAFGVPHSF